jgi:tetratricopeptide (TPR) repeat protein
MLFLAASTSRGQNQSVVLNLPEGSQKAVVVQRIGLTDVTITYHRPLVKGRKIWGDLVPYGKVWRAGANENTLFEVSDPVMIEGQALPKGSYGLHMIPNENSWTVIFSKNFTSWGSFSYDEKEDALRVNVTPGPTDFHEALTYDFDSLAPDSAAATLRWEKLAVPFKISANVPEITLASIRNQLRTVPGFIWVGWNDAATYCLENKTDYDEAMKWVDQSIQAEERFENDQTKAQVLEATGKTAEAKTYHDKALQNASAVQLHGYGRQLLTEKKTDEAIKVFQLNAKKHPNDWVVHASLARAESAQGHYASAAKEMKLALKGAPENQQTYIKGLVDKLEAGKDIN